MSAPPRPAPPSAPRGVYVGLLMVSAAALLLEIGLTRVFSYSIWYHFAFVVISVALLGFGASGTFLSVSRRAAEAAPRDLLGTLAMGGAAGTAAVLWATTRIELDPFALTTRLSELGALVVFFVVVAVPFFCTGACVAAALSRYPRQAGSLYFWDLLGSSLGCFGVVGAIAWLGPKQLVALCATLFVGAGFALSGRVAPRLVLAGAVALCAVEGAALTGDFPLTPTKLGAKYAQAGGRIIDSRWSAVFRTDLYDFGDVLTLDADPSLTVYGSPHGGVGQSYRGGFPTFRFITHDGDASAVMVASDGTDAGGELYRHHLLGVPHRMRPGAGIFLGGVGGGVDVLSAVANHAESVRGVELDPNTVDIVCRAHAAYNSHVCDRPDVIVEAGDARSVLRRSDARYDIINFTGVDTITAAANGAYMLSEGYLYTVEAFEEYLEHLRPEGVVSIITGDIGGGWGLPRMVPRFASVAAAALERRGVTRPADHVLILGTSLPDGDGLSHEVVLTKGTPFSDEDIRTFVDIAEVEGFALWHVPGRSIDTVASRILRSTPDERERLLEGIYLDYSAVTDDRPFFMHFYKWGALGSHLRFDTRYLEATGNVVLIVALLIGALASLLFIVWPAVRQARRDPERRIGAPEAVFFAAIGLGFMLVEIVIVQQLALFLGYPTYSLTVTLFALLGSAALGSLLSRHVPISPRTVWLAVAALAAVMAFHLSVGAALRDSLLQLALPVRVVVASAMVAPAGVVLGLFLPLGVRRLSEGAPGAIPLAWATNGTFSVIGTTLATMLATVVGFTGVFAVAISLYVVAGAAFHWGLARASRREPHAVIDSFAASPR